MSFQTTYGPDGRLRVAILGCTGSIGTQALDVCRQHADRLQVTALSVNSSTSELVAAAREFSVPAVAVADVAHGDDAVLQELPEGTKLGVGAQAVCELARRDDVDCVLVAIVGAAGLEASHAALTSNKRLALANKESLVVGGDLLMPLAQPGQLIPVDSEHSAIYQCYLGENPREAHCIWLTCSGGPFFGRTRDELDRVTRADALAHPTWAMGAKITIDSATLMNKGLEVSLTENLSSHNCETSSRKPRVASTELSTCANGSNTSVIILSLSLEISLISLSMLFWLNTSLSKEFFCSERKPMRESISFWFKSEKLEFCVLLIN